MTAVTSRALTVRQPWATLLVDPTLPKWIETRTRDTKVRGRVGIIAGKRRPPRFWLTDWRNDQPPEPWLSLAAAGHDLDHFFDPAESIDGDGHWVYDYRRSRFPFGALIGSVDLYDSVPIIGSGDFSDQLPYGDFTPGRWAWLTRDPILYPRPIPMTGTLGWKNIDPLTLDDVVTALRGSVGSRG